MKQLFFAFLIALFPMLSHGMGLSLPKAATHIAKSNGAWHLASTWEVPDPSSPSVPGDSDVVVIPSDYLVTVTRKEPARIKFIQIEGTLRMTIHKSTSLLVETIQVASGGKLLIGSPGGYTVTKDSTAEIIFISDGHPIDHGWDPKELSRGMVSMGKVAIYGHPMTHMSEMASSAFKGQSLINLGMPVPSDWSVNDSIVIAGSYFHRDEDFQDEAFKILAINGNTLTLDRPLAYDHLRVQTDMNLHVVNISRNVIFRSESTDIGQRGHIMFMSPDVDINHTAFKDLGRTNKNVPLDEIVVDINSGVISGGPKTNRRGRYPVHFHKNGILPGQNPPSKVFGSVVRRTPGWGFVNHSSHVNFEENICHDFLGAAFVTEDGDELGNFFDNIAIHGIGEDAPNPADQVNEYNQKYKPVRLNFENPYRPQVISDFGFSGEGFWFQGPAIRARNNVANSCNGAGMVWFTTGAINIDSNQYVGFPSNAISQVYQGFPDLNDLEARTWNYSSDSILISDLPILECDGFAAYGCLVGFKLRFNNFDNLAFYREANRPWNYVADIVPVPGQIKRYAKRMKQTVRNLDLWNNEEGFRMRYVEKTDFINVKNINRLDYHVRLPFSGAEHLFIVENIYFNNLVTSGYAIAGLTVTSGFDNSTEITLNNHFYGSYSNASMQKAAVACQEILGSDTLNATPTSATFVWDQHPSAIRFLVRYKRTGDQKWKFLNPTGLGTTSVNVANLNPETDYVFQVNAGCPENVALWSWPFYFTTPDEETPSSKASHDLQGLQVYPNPLQGSELNLKAPAKMEIEGVSLYNAQGIQVGTWKGRPETLSLPADLSAGVYLVQVKSKAKVHVFRIVKQ